MKPTKKPLLVALAIAVPVLLAGGYVLVEKVVKPRYKEYRAANFERSAREFLDKGDYDNAMLFVRKNLASNQQSIANWRLAAEISEKRNDPNALYYLQRLLALEPTLQNRVHVIRLALALRANEAADRAISGAGAEARGSAEFHELAAQASLRAGNTIQAKFHLISLCEIQPDNRPARLDLAQIRLAEANADLRASIRSEIRTLAEDPALRTRALTLLLGDALKHEERREALDLATQLQREATLPVPQAIVVADALRRHAPDSFSDYVTKLQQLAGDRPGDIARVGLFLIGVERSADVKTWLARLPETITNEIAVQRISAGAQASLGEWLPLEAYLKRCDWKELDFERLVLIAMAQRQLGNLPAFGETWRLALTSAGANAPKLEALLQRTILWGWADQRIEVLWRIFQQNPRDSAVRQQLYGHERAQGNTANLNRLFARLLEVSPNDSGAKNNYAYTCLLLGTNATRAATLAREASTSEPKNPYFATTHALALLRAGQPAQARAVLAGVDSLQLWQPERLVVHAAVLAADGSPDEAEPLLASVDERGLLPEERRILTDTREDILRHRRENARTTQIAETVASHREATAAKSILAVLPAPMRTTPTLQMELADSLYARDEFASLAKELGSGTWERHEFLRLALLAYAQRRLDRTSDARDTWRLAVNTAGSRVEQQRILASLASTWSWEDERIDVLSRILQREPTDTAALDEVAAAYLRQRRTTDLARVYGTVVTAGNAAPAIRARFAYYGLLAGTNTSEAHVAAKAAFDQSPADLFVARALALSLWRQGQARAGLQILATNAPRIAPDVDLSLVLALLHEAAGDAESARKSLATFTPEAALPEEKALADELARKLAPAN